MESKIFTAAGALFLAGAIASCTGTTRSESTTENNAATVTYDQNGNPIDSTSATGSNGGGSNNNSNGNSSNANGATNAGGSGAAYNVTTDDLRERGPGRTESTATNSRERQSGTTEPDRVKGQYSAPDGSDAENRDGDYYTRNDKTPMPTGTPIK